MAVAFSGTKGRVQL